MCRRVSRGISLCVYRRISGICLSVFVVESECVGGSAGDRAGVAGQSAEGLPPG